MFLPHLRTLAVAALVLPMAAACANLGVDLDEQGPFSREELEGRIAQLERRAERRPDDPQTWYVLGNTYFDIEAYPHARMAYRRVVELDPARADAWCNLGLTHRLQGNYLNAVTAYETALQIEPDDTVTLRNLSILLQDLGDTEGSLVPLRRLQSLEPHDAALRNELATALVLTGRHEEALRLWDGAGATHHTSAQDALARARALMHVGRLAEASVALDTAGAQMPEHPMLPPARADLYRRLGDYEAAWQQVDLCRQRGIALDPAFIAQLRLESDLHKPGRVR